MDHRSHRNKSDEISSSRLPGKKGNCAKPHEGKGQRGNYLGQPYNTHSRTSEVLMLVFLFLLSLLLASMVVEMVEMQRVVVAI